MARVIDAPIISNDQSLDRLLSTDVPIMFVLWEGRDLSQELGNVLVPLASQEAGSLVVVKINARENPQTAQRFAYRQGVLLVGVKQGQEFTRVESPTAQAVSQHADYLLGRSARPEQTTPRSSSTQQNAARSSGTHQTGGSTASRPVAVTDATFERQVLQSDKPVVVDFWAPWCGPCRIIGPIVEKLAQEFAGKIVFAKVNVDDNPYYAGVYGVQGIPTLLIFQNGKVVNRLVGVQQEHYLRGLFKVLGKNG